MEYFYHFDDEYMTQIEKELESKVKQKLIKQEDMDAKMKERRSMREAYKRESMVGKKGLVTISMHLDPPQECEAEVYRDEDLRSIRVTCQYKHAGGIHWIQRCIHIDEFKENEPRA